MNESDDNEIDADEIIRELLARRRENLRVEARNRKSARDRNRRARKQRRVNRLRSK